MRTALRRLIEPLVRPLVQLHRNERGEALEYLLVLVAFVLPISMLFYKLRDILADYYSMIAFYVGWPFL